MPPPRPSMRLGWCALGEEIERGPPDGERDSAPTTSSRCVPSRRISRSPTIAVCYFLLPLAEDVAAEAISMDVSVILCTWNNSKRLDITLNALRGCHMPRDVRWELVLTDNGSTDDTSTVARRFAGLLPLVYVEEPRPGL